MSMSTGVVVVDVAQGRTEPAFVTRFPPFGPFGRLRLQQSLVEIDRGNMRLTTFPDLEVWSAAPPPAPLLAQLLDSTPYAIAAAVVCVMLAIVVSILATKKKRLAARPEVKRCGRERS